MLGRYQPFADLYRIFLYKIARYVNDILGITIGLYDFKQLCIPHLLLKFGKQRNIRAAEGINGLPVISYRNNLCIRHFRQRFRKIKPLSRNILILIHDDIFKIEFLLHLLHFPKNPRRFIDHIFKINRFIFI